MFTSTGGLVIREPGSSSATVACSGMTMETALSIAHLNFNIQHFKHSLAFL